VNEIGCYSDDVLAVPPLQGSETALRVGLAGNPEMLEVLRWQNLSLMAAHRDSETACPMCIGSCLLGVVKREEPAQLPLGSLVQSVVLLAHILLDRHQRPLECEDERGKHLQDRHFSWLFGA